MNRRRVGDPVAGRTYRIRHLIRMHTAGGGVLAPFRIAAAERARGRQVDIQVIIAEDFEAVRAMAERSDLAIRRTNSRGLLLDLARIRLSRERPDVMHIHSGMDILSRHLRTIRRALPRAVPLVVWLHGSGGLARAVPDELREHRAVAAGADAIIVPSASQREAQIRAGLGPSKVHVVPAIVPAPATARGATRARLGIDKQTRIVLFCGRMIESKNPILAVEAFRACSSTNSVLLMAGDGPLIERVRAAAEDLGDRVRILGHVDDVETLYADADVFLSPSTNESFGLTAIEALQGGTACALSRIRPWTDYLRDGEHVDYFDLTAIGIAQVLDGLLSDDARRADLANAGRSAVEAIFGEDAAMSALDVVYRRLTAGRR